MCFQQHATILALNSVRVLSLTDSCPDVYWAWQRCFKTVFLREQGSSAPGDRRGDRARVSVVFIPLRRVSGSA